MIPGISAISKLAVQEKGPGELIANFSAGLMILS
jgi:hypothetical protein